MSGGLYIEKPHNDTKVEFKSANVMSPVLLLIYKSPAV